MELAETTLCPVGGDVLQIKAYNIGRRWDETQMVVKLDDVLVGDDCDYRLEGTIGALMPDESQKILKTLGGGGPIAESGPTKLMQVERRFSMLIGPKESDDPLEHVIFVSKAPGEIFPIDRTIGETTYESLKRSDDSTTAANIAEQKTNLNGMDGAGANYRCHKEFELEEPASMNHKTRCGVHK